MNDEGTSNLFHLKKNSNFLQVNFHSWIFEKSSPKFLRFGVFLHHQAYQLQTGWILVGILYIMTASQSVGTGPRGN